MERFLEGRTALVTGSVRGIGMAIGQALASAGARIGVHGLATQQEAMAAVEAMRRSGAPEARFFEADIVSVRGPARTPNDQGSCPQSTDRKTSDRPGSPARHGIAPVLSGLRRYSRRSASGSSAPDQSKVGPSWDSRGRIPYEPTIDQAPTLSREPGDRPVLPHQGETIKKLPLVVVRTR